VNVSTIKTWASRLINIKSAFASGEHRMVAFYTLDPTYWGLPKTVALPEGEPVGHAPWWGTEDQSLAA